MDIIWNEIFKELGIFAIFISAIAWLAKKILESYLAQDIEIYKSNLSNASQKEIELFKAQLQSLSKEHDVRYTKLHERRVEIISKLYTLLQEAHYSATVFNMDLNLDIGSYETNLLLSRHPQFEKYKDKANESSEKLLNKELIAQDAYRKVVEFDSFFRQHQLFFSEELSKQIKTLIELLGHIPVFYMISNNKKVEFMDKIKEELNKWNEQEVAVNQTLELIEKEFRHLLGSDKENALMQKTG
jgi:hypothetical protein